MKKLLYKKVRLYKVRALHLVLNNHGSTILTIIICIAFISILGIMILSAALTNLQMKAVDSKSKVNFYSSEIVLDKFRTAALETVAEAIRIVYKDEILVNYAAYLNMDENDRNDRIQKMVIANFIRLAAEADEEDSYENILAKANYDGYSTNMNYFLDKKYLSEEEIKMITPPRIKYERDALSGNNIIRLENILIEYIDKGYRTAISTDIVLSLPRFSYGQTASEKEYSLEQPYKSYVIMTDGRLLSDNYGGTSNIQGNVYASEGIYIDGNNSGHTVNIKGSIIATDKDITVADTAILNLGTTTEELTSLSPVIWADNLITLTTSAYDGASSSKTVLNINGISVVRDDLSLNGRNSDVTLKGAYIGYTAGLSSKGSSIVINGSGSRLDLSDLKELILAGRAMVNVEDNALNRNTEILTGESLAIKSNQRAYLLPGRFIKDLYNNPINHNPLTDDDYAGGVLPSVVIDDKDELIKFNSYISRTTPYKIAAKQTGDSILRYYYLNFDRGWKADTYMVDYYNTYSGTGFFNNMAPFALDEVLLPSNANIYAAGNLMSYSKITGMRLTPGMSSQAELAADPKLNLDTDEEASIDARIHNTIAGLSLNKEIYQNTFIASAQVASLDSIYNKSFNKVASTIRERGASYIIDHYSEDTLSSDYIDDYCFAEPKSGLMVYKNSDPERQSFWVVDGNVIISGDDRSQNEPIFNGILIATGDVEIKDYAKINGLIISTAEYGEGSGIITVGNHVKINGRLIGKRDIHMGNLCNFMADESTDIELNKMIFEQEADILRHLFKGLNLQVRYSIEASFSDLVDLTNMVYYEKWKRLE